MAKIKKEYSAISAPISAIVLSINLESSGTKKPLRDVEIAKIPVMIPLFHKIRGILYENNDSCTEWCIKRYG